MSVSCVNSFENAWTEVTHQFTGMEPLANDVMLTLFDGSYFIILNK